MPVTGNRSNASISKSKLKLSGGNVGGKPNVNLVSAQGEITSPNESNYNIPRRSSDSSSTKKIVNDQTMLPPTSDITQHPFYLPVKKLKPDLQTFLMHDWDTNPKYKHTKLKYYQILYHFNPETGMRPTYKKEILKKEWESNLLPKLSPFLTAPPSRDDSMDTGDADFDYDPLHTRTTVGMLTRAIQKKNPRVAVSPAALKDEVLVLYKHYCDPTLPLPPIMKYTRIPRLAKTEKNSKLSIQELRHALQSYHPELFLNVPVLRLPHYISLYCCFLLEEDQGKYKEELVLGYHYWVVEDLISED